MVRTQGHFSHGHPKILTALGDAVHVLTQPNANMYQWCLVSEVFFVAKTKSYQEDIEILLQLLNYPALFVYS